MDSSEAENPVPDVLARPQQSLQLSGQQRALVEALEQLGPDLRDMYLGSLAVLRQLDNTERFVQAAHTLREMINRVPESLGFISAAKQDRLTDRIYKPEQKWMNAVAHSQCANNGDWLGEIDQPLRQALKALGEFFVWKKENRPKRRGEMAAALRRMDTSGRDIPEPLASIAVDQWDLTRDYFTGVCHYGKNPEEKEFLAYLDALERFMLDRLRPRTFVDFDAVDQIIEEASHGDQA
jgi:hypothetical protein